MISVARQQKCVPLLMCVSAWGQRKVGRGQEREREKRNVAQLHACSAVLMYKIVLNDQSTNITVYGCTQSHL